MERLALIAAIDAVLPQTQCTQCGFDGCAPYAEAIADRRADINQCPPGGDAGVVRLASLLGVAAKPLNPEHGNYKPRAVALIDESHCIGCTLCIQACPVDAIVGAAKLMHTVIAETCTGCERCLPPCPVDCIQMLPAIERSPQHVEAAAMQARYQHEARQRRLEGENGMTVKDAEDSPARISVSEPLALDKAAKIREAMEKAAARRKALPSTT